MGAHRPRIAVTGSRNPETGVWQPKDAYLRAIERAGGAPVAVQAAAQIADADGLLLTGGGDVAPGRYGRAAHPALGAVDEERDELEIAAVREALARDIPMLGICRGLQVLAVAAGGTLWQDLPSELMHTLGHGRGAGRGGGAERARHYVLLRPGSLAARAVGATEFEVNSSHHQAAQTVGKDLVISGWAPDGIIEAVEVPAARFVLALQWHPEDLPDSPEHASLFQAFVTAVRR